MEIKFNEIDVQKLNLKENDTLIVKIKSDYMPQESLDKLAEGLRNILKTNKVVVLAVGESETIDLTVVST